VLDIEDIKMKSMILPLERKCKRKGEGTILLSIDCGSGTVLRALFVNFMPSSQELSKVDTAIPIL
jgi:hypothetical protein